MNESWSKKSHTFAERSTQHQIVALPIQNKIRLPIFPNDELKNAGTAAELSNNGSCPQDAGNSGLTTTQCLRNGLFSLVPLVIHTHL